MKKELAEIEKQEEEEGKNSGNLDVLGGLEWDDAVQKFREGKEIAGMGKRYERQHSTPFRSSTTLTLLFAGTSRRWPRRSRGAERPST
jgi:hypothetical protein